MQEFSNYEKSLLIIDFDSLVGVSRSISNSNMGPSTSFSVSDPRIYNLILHYATAIPQISKKSEYWVALIVKNEESARFINQDIHFAKSDAYMEMEKKEEQKKTEKKCIRCNKNYTDEKNELDNCSFHDGNLIQIKPFDSVMLTTHDVQKRIMKNMMKQENGVKELQFIYICCCNTFNSQGCCYGRHIEDEEIRLNELEGKYDEYLKKMKDIMN